MKARLSVFAIVLALLVTFAPMRAANAQAPAYSTSFTTSITYQNVGANSSSVTVTFYDSAGTAFAAPQAALAAGAGTSLFVGSVGNVPAGFKGAAVLQSSERVVATLVQLPNSTTVKNRPLSNGFSADQGSTTYVIATVLKGTFASNTTFSVQNASAGSVNVNVVLKSTSGATVNLPAATIPMGAAKYYDVNTIAAVPAGFNGSATITATGNVVASAMEASTNSTAVSAFEGVPSGSNTVYMASALCNVFGGQNSSYAVQNTGASAATVTATYSNGGGTQTKTIPAGAKASFVACETVPAGYSGSAVLTSSQPIIAIGKVYGIGLSTAFLGANGGSAKLAAPYVRWASDPTFADGSRQRAYIAIQNVGTTAVSPITVKYYDRNGVLVGTHTISTPLASGAKTNSNAGNLGPAGINFGYLGGFGGGAIIEGPAGSQLTAVIRIVSQTPGAATSNVGEDYNGIPVP